MVQVELAVLLGFLEQDGVLVQLRLELALLLLAEVGCVDSHPPLEWGRDGLLCIDGLLEDLPWGLVFVAVRPYNRLHHVDKVTRAFGRFGCGPPPLLVPLLIQSGLVNLWCHEGLIPGSSSMCPPSHLLD